MITSSQIIAQGSYTYAGGAGFVHGGAGADATPLSIFFQGETGTEWRVDFEEPTLAEVRGVGIPILPFDF